MLAQKFKKEFNLAVQTLIQGNGDLGVVMENTVSQSDISTSGGDHKLVDDLNFQLFRNLMFCLGFIKNLDAAQMEYGTKRKNVLLNLWEMLNVNNND